MPENSHRGQTQWRLSEMIAGAIGRYSEYSEAQYGPDRDDYLKRKKRRERVVGILRKLFWVAVSSLLSYGLHEAISYWRSLHS